MNKILTFSPKNAGNKPALNPLNPLNLLNPLLTLLLLIALTPLMANPMTTPRTYIQKLILKDGKKPTITQEEKKSANEYVMRAWMAANPEEVISTETHPIHTIAVKNVGDGVKFPITAIASIQLGNFRRQWQVGDTLHIVITHKASGESKGWTEVIPEGSALIRHLDDPLIIPPTKKKK